MDAEPGTRRLPHGEYVTISPDGIGPEAMYVAVRSDHRNLVLHAMLPAERPLQVGELVQCTSDRGRWTARVRAVGDGVLELTVPRWLDRSAQRRHLRVQVEQQVWLHFNRETVAGRLLDLSLGGAAVVLERDGDVAPGLAIRCAAPPGDLWAAVTSVRSHEHPLLLVLGLSWKQLGDTGSIWIAREVGTAGRRPPRP